MYIKTLAIFESGDPVVQICPLVSLCQWCTSNDATGITCVFPVFISPTVYYDGKKLIFSSFLLGAHFRGKTKQSKGACSFAEMGKSKKVE